MQNQPFHPGHDKTPKNSRRSTLSVTIGAVLTTGMLLGWGVDRKAQAEDSALMAGTAIQGRSPLRSQLRSLLTKQELRERVACFAEGMDLIGGGERNAAVDHWNNCYASQNFRFHLDLGDNVISGSLAERADLTNQVFRSRSYFATQHDVGNFRYTLSRRRAVIRAYVTAHHFVPGAAVETTYVEYIGEFVRENGQWRAADETIVFGPYIRFQGTPVNPL